MENGFNGFPLGSGNALGSAQIVNVLPTATGANLGQFFMLSGQVPGPSFYVTATGISSLKNYWRLNEPSGSTITDTVSARSGVYQSVNYNLSPIITGDAGSYAVGPVSTSYCGSVTSGATDFVGGSLTIACWVSFGSTLPSSCAALGVDYVGGSVGANAQQLFIQISGTSIQPTFQNNSGGGGIAGTGTTVAANTSYFIAEVYDSSVNKMYLFVNGVQIGTGTSVTGTFNPTTQFFYIGGSTRNPTFGATNKISEVVTFNAALTAAQLLSMYTSGMQNTDNKLYVSTQISTGAYAMKQITLT